MDVKLVVTKGESSFTITPPKNGEWLILQYKESDSGKTITARMMYDGKECGTCKNPEWLCICGLKK